jgi:hypothetical protein
VNGPACRRGNTAGTTRAHPAIVVDARVIATPGAPLDVGAADLAIETFLPADPDGATLLPEPAASCAPVPADQDGRS